MSDWLLGAAEAYNLDSYAQRERYSAHQLIPIETMRTVIRWSMESIPDEVLIGFDPDTDRANPDQVEEVFGPVQTIIPYSGEASEAVRGVAMGCGGLVSSVYSDE